MIDRSLNWGRAVVADFTRRVAPFDTVLDLGAGKGHDLALAKVASPGATMHALECWPPNVAQLQSRGVEVHQLNLERDCLPYGDESIDLILANQVLEHLKEIFWVLHETSRALRIGGHLLVGVPNLASLHNRLLLLVGRQPTSIQNHSAHVRGYTAHDLKRLLGTIFPGGYETSAFAGSNFYPFPSVLARPLAKMMPNGAVSIFLLLRKTREYRGEFLEHPVRMRLETNYYLGET